MSDNEIIAEFMGMDYLMPVCKKWDSLFDGQTFPEGYSDMCDMLDSEVSTYEIKYAYPALVRCIKWYTSQNQKKG